MKAIAPKIIPAIPNGAQGWRRSLRRGSVFHAHILGKPICGARIHLDRNKSESPEGLAHMQYWGICPRCFQKVGAK